jgi:NAD(P)-dependent dehydrogenase (short-subunit alcohol dehydrogenase family)
MSETTDLYAHLPPPVLREADPARGCRRLEGRKVLITAAARGIGFATAVRLSAEGAQVWITDRDAAALEAAAVVASAGVWRLHTQVMDSASAEDTAQALERMTQDSGGFDVLVNNAGGSLHTPYRFLDEDETHWQRVMDLNVMGAVRASRAVLPGMVERGFGRIINFGSKAGRFGSLIAGPNYSAAKGAMAALTRQLAQEFGPHGVNVNCICPGVVMTDRTQALWNERRSAQERERVLQEVPLRRHAEVEDIAASVAFFASEDASFITGVTLDVNGGQAMA